MKSGDNMEGSLDMKGQTGRNKIINLATPTTEFHAANKTYIDELFNFNTYAELS